MKTSRFALLDGLRGVAAIFVVTRHTQGWGFELYRSYLAVDIFFLLSGFVIAYAYEEKLKKNEINIAKFIKIRLIRLYPVFIVSWLLCSLIAIGKHIGGNPAFLSTENLAISIALTAFYIPSHAAGDSLFPLNGVYWSLFFEILVNIIYAALVGVLSDKLLILIVIVSGGVLSILSWHFGHLDVGFTWGYLTIATGFFRAIFGIFLGILLYRKRHYFRGQTGMVLSALLIFLIAVILGSPSVFGYDYFIDLACIFIIFPLILIFLAAASAVKMQPFWIFLGATSYPLYVLHLPLGLIFHAVIGQSINKYNPVPGFVYLILVCLFCYFLETRLDAPLRTKISKFLKL